MMICPECKKREGMLEPLRAEKKVLESEKAALERELALAKRIRVRDAGIAGDLLDRAEKAEADFAKIKSCGWPSPECQPCKVEIERADKAEARVRQLEQDCDKYHDLTIHNLESDLKAALVKANTNLLQMVGLAPAPDKEKK